MHLVRDLNELDKFSKNLQAYFNARTIVLISGPLGIGKTKLIETIVRSKEFSESSSPTFTLHQVYRNGKSHLAPEGEIDHFDLYRIENEEQLETAGLWDVLEKASGLVLVEWAERLPKAFRAPGWQVIRVHMDWRGEYREITLEII